MSFLLRLSLFSTLITPGLIAISCSFLSKTDPPLSSRAQTFLLSYEKAKQLEKSDPTGSCELYFRLSQQQDFTLKDLSTLKALEFCDQNYLRSNPNFKIPSEMMASSPWLTDLILDLTEKKLTEEQNFTERSKVYLAKAARTTDLRLKVELLQKAKSDQDQVVSDLFKNSLDHQLQTEPKNVSLIEEQKKIQSEIQAEILKWAPRFILNPETKDFFRIGNDWIFHRQFQKGRSFFNQIIQSKDKSVSEDDRYQAFRAIRNSFKTEQKKEEHISQSEKLALWLERQKNKNANTYQRLNEAVMTWSRAVWTAGSLQKAIQILNRFEPKLKGKTSLEEMYWVRGRMSEEVQDFNSALAWFEKALQESAPKTAYRERILFSQAWIYRKMKNFKAASEALNKLKIETQDPFALHRYSFWYAKSLKQAGQLELANQELASLTDNDPMGYYGAVARYELGQSFPALNSSKIVRRQFLKKPSSISQSDFELKRALVFVKEKKILENFLDYRTARLETSDLLTSQKLDPKEHEEVWLYYLKSYAQAGLYNPLFRKFGTLDFEARTNLLGQFPELMFPQNFLPEIKTWAERFGVKPELMLSIIRQESAFDPDARSRADALGLMQLLPSVARSLEKKTGIKLENDFDLFLPEKNIPFGAALLSQLNQKYNGQFILSVAAYNASEKAIRSWLKTKSIDDPLEFIEDIPYEETKGYVKLVLRNFIFYTRMGQPDENIEFPAWCLQGLQSVKTSTK